MTGSADPAGAFPLPLTADGVTAAWLSAALRTRYPGVTVIAARPAIGVKPATKRAGWFRPAGV